MVKSRLDQEMTARELVSSRSQAESYIGLGLVRVNKKIIRKAAHRVSSEDKIVLIGDQYVSRAALKLASIADDFGLDFRGKCVLDVGSSTGGFTDYALQHGADKVIAVDVGTDQLHPSLRGNPKVDLHEKTDIRDFIKQRAGDLKGQVGMIVADVSFISLTKILPDLRRVCDARTELVMMCKPQFEAQRQQINKGVVKNSAMRRQILRDFEAWLRPEFVIVAKSDSAVAGAKGNVERFYLLKASSGDRN